MDEQIAEAPPRPRWKRPLIVAGVGVFVGIWGYGFWYDAHRGTPEPLNPASTQAATAACQQAITSLSALTPLPAHASPTVSERTTLVRAEDAVFTDLVARLRTVHPTDHDGARAIADFATDWQHLTEARGRYVAAVLSGAKTPKLYVPVDPAGKPITIRMREYAEIHHLTACTPNALQGEVVEGPRTYLRVP